MFLLRKEERQFLWILNDDKFLVFVSGLKPALKSFFKIVKIKRKIIENA